jgi:hypothetical protein
VLYAASNALTAGERRPTFGSDNATTKTFGVAALTSSSPVAVDCGRTLKRWHWYRVAPFMRPLCTVVAFVSSQRRRLRALRDCTFTQTYADPVQMQDRTGVIMNDT